MPAETSVNSSSTDQKRIAVLGASGYTGEEVVRLLAQHPNFKVTALTGESQAGKVISSSLTFSIVPVIYGNHAAVALAPIFFCHPAVTDVLCNTCKALSQAVRHREPGCLYSDI